MSGEGRARLERTRVDQRGGLPTGDHHQHLSIIIKGIVIIITQLLYHPDNCEHQDYEIMGELEYSSSKTTALVKFQAHKFPYTRFSTNIHTIIVSSFQFEPLK